MALKILNLADIDACPDVFEGLAGLAAVTTLPASQQALESSIGDYDAYIASLKIQVNENVLARAGRLRVIATPSTGLDHLDLKLLAERDIAVLSLKGDREFLDNLTATAELAWGLLLVVLRHIPWAFAAAQSGQWTSPAFSGSQLAGKTLGIVGYGRLGRMVAEYGRAFRMKVLVCTRREVEVPPGMELCDFDTVLSQADVVSLHVPLEDATRGLIDASALARMKPTAIFINTSRGAIVDEAALLDALVNGRLAGAGLDVLDGEWRSDLENHPLIRYAATHRNVVITPHIGGLTAESQRLAYLRIAEKLAAHLATL